MIEAIIGTIIVLFFMSRGKTLEEYEEEERGRPRY